jgi:ribonuclease HII
LVLVDGRDLVPGLPHAQQAVVDGDALMLSIAAASVVAKVVRDRIMQRLDRVWPAYGFAQHKGYGTPEHLEALERLGPCPIHRYSFTPVCVLELALG